jgi:peptidoglycan hydrolase-like protein with peptidoglycan-binding domain
MRLWPRGRIVRLPGRSAGHQLAGASPTAHLEGARSPDFEQERCSVLSRPEPLAQSRRAAVAALLVALTLPFAAVAPTIENASAQSGPVASAAQKSLKKGSRGKRVRQLQRALGIPADGIFGKGTKRAVKRYQRRHGLVVDGIAGPQTLRALGVGTRSAGRKSGSRGQRGGKGVRALQRKLGVPADGAFGPQTERAVKSFQRRRGLVADGVVGPQTRSALGLGPGKVLKRKRGGSRGGHGGGRKWSIIRRVIAAGNRIANTPYRYGGGHGSFNDSGYDCSGSISYALHGGGLLRSPLDSTGFMSYGRPGPGRHITIYANSGHAYMVVNGRRFDTSARSQTGSRWTNTMRSSAGYVARHPAGF